MSASSDLNPIVVGRLSEREAGIINTIKSGGRYFASTIQIDAHLALAAIRAASLDKRDFSSFCAVALQEYTENHKAEPIDAQFFAKLQATLAEIDPESQRKLIDGLDKLISSATRKRRLETAPIPV